MNVTNIYLKIISYLKYNIGKYDFYPPDIDKINDKKKNSIDINLEFLLGKIVVFKGKKEYERERERRQKIKDLLTSQFNQVNSITNKVRVRKDIFNLAEDIRTLSYFLATLEYIIIG